MPKLYVATQSCLDNMTKESIDWRVLTEPDEAIKHLSAEDLAQNHIALRDFMFSFDQALDLTFDSGPVSVLLEYEEHERPQRLLDRVNARIDSLRLQESTDSKEREVILSYAYTLTPLDDHHWVVGAQRCTQAAGDPWSLAVRKNLAFFDALIAQSLHTLSFTAIARTNVFTHYLNALKLSVL